jgi:hypothetical protein
MENCHSFLPIFQSSWIFSDWHEISTNYGTAHPVHCKGKTLEDCLNFYVLKDLMPQNNFDAKTRFLNLFKKYIVIILSVFNCRNLIRGPKSIGKYV